MALCMAFPPHVGDYTYQMFIFFCLSDWTSSTRGGVAMQVDFSKAFDVVQHDKLFTKLRAYGIDELLLQ